MTEIEKRAADKIRLLSNAMALARHAANIESGKLPRSSPKSSAFYWRQLAEQARRDADAIVLPPEVEARVQEQVKRGNFCLTNNVTVCGIPGLHRFASYPQC